MKRNTYFIWQLIFIIIGFSACNSKPKDILVDNPTEKSISIKFDQTENINLLPGESKIISLNFGKENLVVNGDKKYELVLDKNKDYLLNPGLETYYIETIVYGSPVGIKQYYSNYGVHKSEIDNFLIEGEYEEIKSKILIEKSWYFSFDEEAHNRVKKVSNDEYFKVRKLHRSKDLKSKIYDNMIQQLKEGLKK